jgi:hypothetical protein
MWAPELVINMDETSWRQINAGRLTIDEKGAETVNCYFRPDLKTCLTAVAAITAAGEKLPLWILARGKTTRCETRHRSHDAIPAAVNRGDLMVSHRCQETKDIAQLLQIQLEFIPEGMTGECPPLDRRIFGNLKSRARSRYAQMCCQGEDPTMEDSVAMLVDAWKSIGQEEVLDSRQPTQD